MIYHFDVNISHLSKCSTKYINYINLNKKYRDNVSSNNKYVKTQLIYSIVKSGR